MRTTTTLDLDRWAAAGFLLVREFLDAGQLERLRTWVADIEAWPAGSGPWLHHDEMTDAGPRRARTENFAPSHDGMRRLLTEGALVDMASALMDEPAVLFKEKINYKHPGGAGFVAHQDQAAYPHVTRTVTCLLAVDDADLTNGCLEFAPGRHGDGMLPRDGDGCVPAALAASLPWQPVPARAGDLLWFDGFLPHRSGPNPTNDSRRALYLTYNRRAEGDLHDAYYADKRRRFAERGATTERGAERISLIGHFQGRPVPREPRR